jgi:hypothetical protein
MNADFLMCIELIRELESKHLFQDLRIGFICSRVRTAHLTAI